MSEVASAALRELPLGAVRPTGGVAGQIYTPEPTVGRIRMTIDRLAGVRDREDRPTDHTQPAGAQR